MSSFVPFDDARTLLLAANLVSPSLIEWPNEPFQEPKGDPPSTWLSVEAQGHTLSPIEIGANVWQEEGTLFINVMTPAGRGTDAARQLAKSIANVYRGLPARNVVYKSASIGAGMLVEERGIWWMITVSIDWKYQDIGP